MATLAGVVAASHIPRMANAPDAPGTLIRDEVKMAYRALGNAMHALRPTLLVIVAPDHFQNFFIDNMPAVCVGCGETHRGPAEPWIENPPQEIPGDAAFGIHLVQSAYRAGFDPSFSHQLRLDHGYVLPLRAADFSLTIPIVPIVVNAVQAPMPTAERLFAWGGLLADSIASFDRDERILVIASGGLSHSIAEPGMGRIDEVFDRRFLALLENGATDTLATFFEAGVGAAGNGSHEMRHWFVAHGAARARGFNTIYYRPIREWYLGVAMGLWKTS
jgi:aromatic ring-opening dioxygenase catalytic subunit (LigB family)